MSHTKLMDALDAGATAADIRACCTSRRNLVDLQVAQIEAAGLAVVPRLEHLSDSAQARLMYDEITYTDRPELFEPDRLADRYAGWPGLPWPLEPHNRCVIPEDWWRPVLVHDLPRERLAEWAENMADCEAHPGFLCRNVQLAQLATVWTPVRP